MRQLLRYLHRRVRCWLDAPASYQVQFHDVRTPEQLEVIVSYFISAGLTAREIGWLPIKDYHLLTLTFHGRDWSRAQLAATLCFMRGMTRSVEMDAYKFGWRRVPQYGLTLRVDQYGNRRHFSGNHHDNESVIQGDWVDYFRQDARGAWNVPVNPMTDRKAM